MKFGVGKIELDFKRMNVSKMKKNWKKDMSRCIECGACEMFSEYKYAKEVCPVDAVVKKR